MYSILNDSLLKMFSLLQISVASITSEVAGEVKGSSGESDMFELLRPAAAMAELYARAGGHSLSENLDNVNPPSTFNEITDCTFESTMEPGTETLDTDTELEPEDLPVDSKTGTPIHSNDSTPKKRRRLTPKQRRQMVKDRYATYTIADDETKRPDASKFQLPLNEVKPQSDQTKTPKQKRLEEKDRFLTQTITTNAETPVQMTEAKEPEARNIKTAKQKRLEDKDRYLTQTIESPITAVSSPERVSELGDEEMAALQRDACIIATALQDPSESTELLECETLSLISNDSETQHQGISDDEEPAGPKIIKPTGKEAEENVEGSPKGIRGRRKALYSSPITVRARGGKVPVPTSAKTNTPTVRPTRASALRQRGNSPRSATRTSIPSTSSSPGGSPKNKATKIVKPIKAGTKPAPKPPNNSPENKEQAGPPKLVKQGTFTKDSTIDPAVKSASKSRLPVRSPSADTITSAPAFRTQKSLESEVRTGARAATRLRRDTVQPSPSPKPGTKTPVKATSKSPAKPRSPLSFRRASSSIKPSFSNHSLQNAESSMSTKVKTSSTPSLNNTGTKKKEVTSKIASLWKKVEDSRYKQKYVKDTRVWITNGTPDTPAPLVRSNTFEKDEKPKTNTLAETLAKLTLQAEEAGLQTSSPNKRLTNGSLLPKSDKSKPQASAVVQPFNYNPPADVATSSKTTTNAEEDVTTSSVRVTSV